jgi:hypothetical protein
MGARRDVVARHIAVPLHPLANAKCGITVELLDLVCLVFSEMRDLERYRKKYFHELGLT